MSKTVIIISCNTQFKLQSSGIPSLIKQPVPENT